MKLNDGGPAFGCVSEHFELGLAPMRRHVPGMSLRAWLAGQALANPDLSYGPDVEVNATRVVEYADAVLAELAKEQP